MPVLPKRPCAAPGCRALVDKGRCEAHQRASRQVAEDLRLSSAKRGYGRRWRRAREIFLQAHPLCECDECQAGAKRVTASEVVDHIEDHKGDPIKFWDEANWQALSKICHDRKTARTTGFGRTTGVHHDRG